MAEVMPHPTTTLHQLYLLLVDAQNGTIRVGIAIETDDEAITERCHLVVVADACHRAAGRYYIAEVVEQLEYLFCRHRVLILLLYTGYLVSNAPVHVQRRLLVDIAYAVLHCVLVHPHSGGQFVTAKISQ